MCPRYICHILRSSNMDNVDIYSMMTHDRSGVWMIILIIILAWGCTPKKEIVPEGYQPKYGHDAYVHQMHAIDLDKTSLGQAWLNMADDALNKPIQIESPFAESFYIDEREVGAAGYLISTLKGHKVDIRLMAETNDSTLIFLDVFRVDSTGHKTHIASAEDSTYTLSFEPQESGDYIIRLQPEILRGGRYRIEIVTGPSLSFPVAGRGRSDIGSLFGVPRDAGRRKHHGIDIFARRHTPIIAPSDGQIKSTEPNELGGQVIWMRDDDRRQTLYFAHLEHTYVVKDQYVSQGDTIASIGNSGNAKTTAPHLHFGIYQDGPVDPYPFVVEGKNKFKKELARASYIGSMIRSNKETQMKLRSQKRRGPKQKLMKHQMAMVTGISGAYYKIRLPDGSEGYLFYDDIQSLDRHIQRQKIVQSQEIYSHPKSSIAMDSLATDRAYRILGYHSDQAYVEIEDGRVGWINI